jgi:hypothetical protein
MSLREDRRDLDPAEIRRRLEARQAERDAEDLQRLREQSDTPRTEPVTEDEPTPTTHPHLFIETRTPELTELVEEDGERRPVIVREVLTGRILIGWRRRRPEDGDADFVIERPNHRTPRPPDTLPAESFDDWVRWVYRYGARPEKNMITQRGPTRSVPNSDGRYYPVRCGVRVDPRTGEEL